MRTPATILVVDDDSDVLTAARLLLKQHFAHVLTSDDPGRIREIMAAEPIDVFLIDMNFAIGRNTGAEGLKWLNEILAADEDAVVILMTAFGGKARPISFSSPGRTTASWRRSRWRRSFGRRAPPSRPCPSRRRRPR